MLIVFSLLTCVALVGFGCHWLIVGGALVLILRALQLPLVVTVVAQRHPGADECEPWRPMRYGGISAPGSAR